MRNFFKVSEDNATDTLYSLLQNLKAKVTWETARKTMQEHPDFPSLLCMSEVLLSWNIDNAALQLNTVEQLRELPLPFIAHLKRKGGWYVLVNQIHDNHIQYTDSETGKVTLSLDEFEKNWAGVVLLAETDEHSGEVDYHLNRKKERLNNMRAPFVLGVTFLVILLAFLVGGRNYLPSDWLLFLTKTSGLFLSSLLIIKQLGRRNDLTDLLCSIHAKTNCEGVLNSPAAKLWGWLSWSDLGLLYFSGGLITLVFAGNQPQVRPLLNDIAILAMPYIVFSVYYQAYKVRQWCTLCLGVQAIFVIEGLMALTQVTTLPASREPYFIFIIAYLLPTLAWVLIRPLLTGKFQTIREHEELITLKRNPATFITLLKQQPQAPTISADLHSIVLGNLNSENKIIMVTDPYCGSCSKSHRDLVQIVADNQNINVTIIFSTGNTSSRATRVAAHILTLARQGIFANKALEDWYSQKNKDYDMWAKQYPLEEPIEDHGAICKSHRQWCLNADILVTPTIYVNGHKMPESYKLENLPWILNSMDTDKVFESGI